MRSGKSASIALATIKWYALSPCQPQFRSVSDRCIWCSPGRRVRYLRRLTHAVAGVPALEVVSGGETLLGTLKLLRPLRYGRWQR